MRESPVPSNHNNEPKFQVCTPDYQCLYDRDCVDGKCSRTTHKCVCNEDCKTGSKCTSDLQCGISSGVPIGSCNAYSKGCLCPPPTVSFGHVCAHAHVRLHRHTCVIAHAHV